MVTVQVPAPVQAPLQPAKVEPAFGVAVNVTLVPEEKFAAQVAGQLIPAGLLITVPAPLPASARLRVNEEVVPVPESETVWTLPGMLLELSVMVSVAVSSPLAEGVKRMKIVQEVFGGNCPPAELHVSPGPSEKFPGDTA